LHRFSGGIYTARLQRITNVLTGFFLGQGTLQAVVAVSGLFLVRNLSVEHYAQYGLAFGFQTTATMLMDLGYAGTIIPLVGTRVNDRALVGSYLRAAKHLRDRAFWTLAPFAAIAFLAIMHKHHWSWTTQTVLVLSVLLALYSSGPAAYYAAPLILYRRLREYYLPQTLSGFARLLILLGLYVAGGLNACTASALSALNLLLNSVLLRKNGRRYVEWPASNEPEVNREVRKYIFPALPTFIFAAFQSQIALFLINSFGQTVNVAQVAALGRLAQLFMVLTSFNLIIVEPRIARLDRKTLPGAYVRLILLACAFSLAVVPFSFLFPAPFVWLIGPHYRSLGNMVGWVVLTSCFNFLASLIWVMNRARKWVFWRGTILEIAAMISVDVCFVAFVGVRSTRQAIFFTLASSACALCTHAYIGVYGFLRGGEDRSAAPRPSLETVA
jgi:hypothetical protein